MSEGPQVPNIAARLASMDQASQSPAAGLTGNIGMASGIGVGDKGMTYGIGIQGIDLGIGGELGSAFSFLKEGALERNFIDDYANGTVLGPGNIAATGEMHAFTGVGKLDLTGVGPLEGFNVPTGLPGPMGVQKGGGTAPAA